MYHYQLSLIKISRMFSVFSFVKFLSCMDNATFNSISIELNVALSIQDKNLTKENTENMRYYSNWLLLRKMVGQGFIVIVVYFQLSISMDKHCGVLQNHIVGVNFFTELLDLFYTYYLLVPYFISANLLLVLVV